MIPHTAWNSQRINGNYLTKEKKIISTRSPHPILHGSGENVPVCRRHSPHRRSSGLAKVSYSVLCLNFRFVIIFITSTVWETWWIVWRTRDDSNSWAQHCEHPALLHGKHFARCLLIQWARQSFTWPEAVVNEIVSLVQCLGPIHSPERGDGFELASVGSGD